MVDLLTPELKAQLLSNGEASARGDDDNVLPVVKLFTPDGSATWLLSELDPDDHDLAFGLCDLGLGFPELGNVRLSELVHVRGRLGLPVERDLSFKPAKTLLDYARLATAEGRIVT